MRVLVLLLFTVGVVVTAPQSGYNYQIHIDSAVKNDLTQEQYQLIQQYVQQQQQSEQHHQSPQPQVLQIFQQPEVSTASQTVTQTSEGGSGGYHFANQLVQQTQQQVQPQVQEPPPVVIEQQVQQQQQQPVQIIQQEHHVESVVKPEQQPLSPPLPPPSPPQPQPQPLVEQEPRYQAQPQEQPQYQHHQHREKPIQYNKEFFYLSAPQEDFEQSRDFDNELDSIRKNIRVLFIRAPEQNGIENAALQLAKQSADQQTVVYVLTKQPDTSELASKLQQIRSGSQSRPDVMFVKYRTPAEAEHAQRTIQAQYEALDGPNHFNHEGVAPTHDFVGSINQHNGHINPRTSATAKTAEAPSAKYLPAAKKL